MKTKLLFCILLLPATFSFSQNASTCLTWMKGDNTVDQVGIYGSTGIAASINKPGARDYAATWKDNSGNLWLFGGYGYADSTLGFLNDLWKYNPSTNQWAWIKGNNTTDQFAVYGTRGIANAANTPGAIYASISWTDNAGNLWLFGGFGYTDNDFGFLNDLWKYDVSTNQWTWVKGGKTIDRPGTYGVQGIANTSNNPGGRYGSRTWTDTGGNLWLFGGYGHDNSTASGNLNDLWKFNPSTNEWTWIKGDEQIDQPGVYGEQGVAGAANKPGARYVSVSWTDSNNNFWLFGGSGFNGSTQGMLNDLWKYDPIRNQWTWVKGDSLIDRPGIYGSQNVPDAANKPGARYVSVSWTDANDNLWLFGGYGFDAGTEGYLNDLWKYSPIANKWVWVKGDKWIDQLAVYGVQGIPSVTNKSGSRTSSVSWTGGTGDLWLFGGYGFDANTSGILNDLWKISSITSPLPVHLNHFSGILNNDFANLQWQTAQELNFDHFTIQRSFDGVNFSAIGRINGLGHLYSASYVFNDELRNRIEQKIFYRLQLTDKDGRVTYSRTIRFDRSLMPLPLHIFPNPVAHSLTLSFDQVTSGKTEISILNMSGIALMKQRDIIRAGRASIAIDVSALSPATYLLSLTNASGTFQQKFIIAR